MDFLFEFLNILVNEKGTTCHDYLIAMVLNDKTYIFSILIVCFYHPTPLLTHLIVTLLNNVHNCCSLNI
jgi:hypothetical protein